MNNKKLFLFEQTAIRAAIIDNNVWLAAIDVCKAIGYAPNSSAIKTHCIKPARFYTFETNGGSQDLRIIDGDEILKLATKRNSLKSASFEDWLYDNSLLPKPDSNREAQPSGDDSINQAIDDLKYIMRRQGFTQNVIGLVVTFLKTLCIEKFYYKTKGLTSNDLLKKNSRLSEDEKRLIKDNKELSINEIGEIVGRSHITVTRYRKKIASGAGV
jgi:prophage antirepressor-like protein